jgi:hypothetical protein
MPQTAFTSECLRKFLASFILRSRSSFSLYAQFIPYLRIPLLGPRGNVLVSKWQVPQSRATVDFA